MSDENMDRLEPAKKSEAYHDNRNRKNLEILYTFLESGMECARLKGGTKSEYQGLRRAAVRHKLPIDVTGMGNNVFLVRDESKVSDKEES